MKPKLRELILAGRAKEESELVPQVDDSPPQPGGAWTAKDQLAHLTAWRQVAVAELNALRTGGPAPDVSDDDDVENAKIYEQTHGRPAAQVVEAARNSWDELSAAVEACSEDDLAKPRLRRPKQPAWQAIPNNSYFHLAEHLGYWHADRGDETAAEAAARWGFELMTSTFSDERTLGVAEYNLGCFYARRGRLSEAMPHLRTAIRLRPDLREHARQDSDLDPIRSAAELATLLG